MTIYLELGVSTPIPAPGPEGDPCDARECPSDLSIFFIEFSDLDSTEGFTLDLGPEPSDTPLIYGLSIE